MSAPAPGSTGGRRVRRVPGARYRESVVYDRGGIPDRYWYGYEPELLADIRGKRAETAASAAARKAPT